MPPHADHTPDPLWPIFSSVLRRDGFVGFQLLDRMPHIPGVINPGAMAMVDRDTGVVFLRSDLTDGQMRACTGHELHHLDDPTASEREVEFRTAKVMVPLSMALAARTNDEVDSAARVLRVDRKLILSRLRGAADEIRQEAS